MFTRLPFMACLVLGLCAFSERPNGVSLQSQEPACVKDICFEKTIEIQGEAIPLRGTGLYRKTFFDIYAIAFYADEAAEAKQDILEKDVPKSIVMEYKHDLKKDQVLKAIQKGAKKIGASPRRLEEGFAQVSESFEDIEKGDRLEFKFVPGEGTHVIKNGTLEQTIKGDDFARVFYRIWLSPYYRARIKGNLLQT